jgi:hypothetical protein
MSDNMFLSGNKLQDPSPFSVPHSIPTMDANRIFRNSVETSVWPDLRGKKLKTRQERLPSLMQQLPE